MLTAPAAIAVGLKSDPADLEHAFDEGRVAGRLLVAAGILGLAAGVAWIKASAREEARAILGLPADDFVRTVVAVGHPSDAARQPKSAPGEARLPRTETVFRERWPQD